jgi:DNA-binding PadR family transcriptional regulator
MPRTTIAYYAIVENRGDDMEPAEYLPLTPPVFHVLLSLADGDKHGYAILKEVEDRTDGKVQLSTGTLYAIIKRLLNDGLIEETDERPDHDDERRRYYRMTVFGKKVAAAEAERMEEMIAAAREKRLIRKPRLA